MTWPQRVSYGLETWPCYNIHEPGIANISQLNCACCSQRGVISSRIILYGQPYNPDTIESVQQDNRLPYEKVISYLS